MGKIIQRVREREAASYKRSVDAHWLEQEKIARQRYFEYQMAAMQNMNPLSPLHVSNAAGLQNAISEEFRQLSEAKWSDPKQKAWWEFWK